MSGFTVVSFSASATTPANSRSTMSIFEPAWSSWKAMMAASSRVLSECSTALTIGTPKCASSMGGRVGQKDRHRIALADAPRGQRRRQLQRAGARIRRSWSLTRRG